MVSSSQTVRQIKIMHSQQLHIAGPLVVGVHQLESSTTAPARDLGYIIQMFLVRESQSDGTRGRVTLVSPVDTMHEVLEPALA